MTARQRDSSSDVINPTIDGEVLLRDASGTSGRTA
jgi:hypothetical protein